MLSPNKQVRLPLSEPEPLTISRRLPGLVETGVATSKLAEGLAFKRKVARRRVLDCRREQAAVEHLLTLPRRDESLHFVVDGRFEPCHLIPAVRRLSHPSTITRLDIATLSFNVENVHTLARGIDQKKIGTVFLTCSHYFAKAEPEAFQTLVTELVGRGGRVAACRVHAKLILFEMSDGNHYVIEGSGNLRACRSIEQFTLSNDEGLLRFHRGWLEDEAARAARHATT